MQFNPGTRFNQYEILSPLGKGGMGEVYLARDAKLERNVALKILPLEFTFQLDRLRRFEQEAKAVSALNHPNIITIHEIGATNNTHFITTEFIAGQTLRDRLAKEKLSLTAALEIAIQTATALSAAHAANIIHRDIKPENIMLRTDGIVKVLDFGLAKLTEKREEAKERLGEDDPTLALSPQPAAPRAETDPGTVMGTAHYMSPEQARGEKVDARSDIFSLGVVLYEMVAGQRPFDGVNIFEQVAAVLDREPALLTDALPELQRIVSKALRKDREQRYQHINDLLLDLKDLKQELEIEAKLKGRQTVSDVAQTVSLRPDPTDEIKDKQTTSSASIILSELKRHKLGTLIALVLVVTAVVAIFFVQRTKDTEVAIDSIAVLPFTNQNPDPEMEIVADNLTESIINNLSQLSALSVINRNSAFHYKGKADDPQSVGKALQVRAVVVGRVLQRGESLIVSAELVDVRDNKQLWGQHYNNRKLSDFFAVQEEIAKEISETLRLKLTGAEKQQLAKRPTENLQAFQFYMQGRQFSQRNLRDNLLTAIRYYEQALEEDRNYALAYAGLADAYSVLGLRGYLPSNEARRKAEAAARKALALDENLAEAHAALGLAVVGTPYNFPLEEREERRAIELSPSLAVAHYYLGISLVRVGRIDEGLAEMLKARTLDPLSPNFPRQVASAYYLQRDYARALALLRQANELGPAFSVGWEIGLYVQTRLFDEALAGLEKEKQTRKSDPILIYDTGMVYAAQGKRAEAIQVIKELEAMSGASLSQTHNIARIYAVLNEKELVFSWLERGLAAGTIGAFHKDDPIYDTIRSDARYGDLLRRMGFPQ